MEKERVYITDITLHSRDYRQTTNYSKTAMKGRMYSPLPKPPKGISNDAPEVDRENHTIKVSVQLPQDLMDRWDKGEIEVMAPEDGIPVIAGKDLLETMDRMEKKERTQLIHRSRNNYWRKD